MLYEVSPIYEPSAKEREDGRESAYIGPITVDAPSGEVAVLRVGSENADILQALNCRWDQVRVYVRPF